MITSVRCPQSPPLPLYAAFALALASLASSASSASAQSLDVSSVSRSGNQLTVTVQNTGPSATFRLEVSTTTASNAWQPVNGVVFSPVAGQNGFHRATFTLANTARQFFRVVGLTSGTSEDDPDGDGLTTTYEGTLGTNPNLFDTDGDGFSDGQEFTFGTNPLLSSSKPVLATKPAVEFVTLTGTGVEGPPYAAQLTLDKPFTGTVKYAIVPANSTAAAPGDFSALSGTVAVNGTTASIPITWTDDLILKPDRLLALDVIALETDGYRTGGRSRHLIRLEENDWWWNGALQDGYAQRNFRVKLVRNAAGLQATFVAGAGNDGLPLLAGEAAGNQTSQTEGVVPVGIHAGTVQFDSTTHFRISSPPMNLPDSDITGTGAGLTCTLILESLPAAGSLHTITPMMIAGTYTEQLTSSTASHLNRTFTGMFVLARSLPVPAPVTTGQ